MTVFMSPFSNNTEKLEVIMKINALLIAFLVVLAGCSASVHGDVEGKNTPATHKSSTSIVSNTGANQTGVSVNR